MQMKIKRVGPLLLTVGAMAVGIGIYAAVDRAEPSEAGSLQAADQAAAVTPAVRDAVQSAEGGPLPLAPGASDAIRHLFTPSDPGLPALFTVPTADGGECIVSSVGVIASCLPRASSLPGTITAADDSEGDDLPPFVYGLVRPSVRGVSVSVGGSRYQAALGGGFYMFQLPSPDNRVDDLEAVVFTLGNGREVVRHVRD